MKKNFIKNEEEGREYIRAAGGLIMDLSETNEQLLDGFVGMVREAIGLYLATGKIVEVKARPRFNKGLFEGIEVGIQSDGILVDAPLEKIAAAMIPSLCAHMTHVAEHAGKNPLEGLIKTFRREMAGCGDPLCPDCAADEAEEDEEDIGPIVERPN